ncbi:MAG TPA: hypothetical protein VGK94_06320 [Candidatus Polarisedimenticolia bacterium]|jgi:hypothetical protein
MSIALPGWGHLYLGRRILGASELAVGLLLFGWALARLGLVFMSVLDERAQTLDLVWTCLFWALVLVGYSVADGAFTLIVSRRRLVPDTSGSRH